MRLRKFFNELSVVSPFLLVGAITVQARTRVEDYVPAQYSTTLNRKIVAYSEPVRLVETAVAMGIHKADPVQIRKIAETWRAMSREGALQPLSPETADDSTREGIKGQIRKAADDLAAALQHQARKAIREGQPYAAAQDAILSIEAIQGFKYSDLYSVGMLSVRQNGAFHLLDSIGPKLTESEKKSVAERLDAIRTYERPLADLVMAKQRVLMVSREAGVHSANATQLDLMLEIAKAIDTGVNPESLREQLDKLRLTAKADDVSSFLPEFRFAFNARRNSSRIWATLQDTLRASRI